MSSATQASEPLIVTVTIGTGPAATSHTCQATEAELAECLWALEDEKLCLPAMTLEWWLDSWHMRTAGRDLPARPALTAAPAT